ncbi:hypothetical protein [Antrihabitans spumae]|uniref:Uncharacterized protein n=1 Tax=Antrihabitans spumae TaxID=3373370 RepID=A0ABW7JV12_9NOCA
MWYLLIPTALLVPAAVVYGYGLTFLIYWLAARPYFRDEPPQAQSLHPVRRPGDQE